MGDNIYLGDRNGVRTPMQWTADRNAGFSRANPAQLYSPVIMDPVYGYEAVNVEAQLSDSSSHSALDAQYDRAAQTVPRIRQGNARIPESRQSENSGLSSGRYEGDQVLCVANLSRFSQPVELDLSHLAGMTPVEMLGYTEFPRIGTEPTVSRSGHMAFSGSNCNSA